MAIDPAVRKELDTLKKQLEALRDRHNDLSGEVHRIDGNVDRAINGVNKMCTQATFDGSWALLNKRLDGIEAAIKGLQSKLP